MRDEVPGPIANRSEGTRERFQVWLMWRSQAPSCSIISSRAGGMNDNESPGHSGALWSTGRANEATSTSIPPSDPVLQEVREGLEMRAGAAKRVDAFLAQERPFYYVQHRVQAQCNDIPVAFRRRIQVVALSGDMPEWPANCPSPRRRSHARAGERYTCGGIAFPGSCIPRTALMSPAGPAALSSACNATSEGSGGGSQAALPLGQAISVERGRRNRMAFLRTTAGVFCNAVAFESSPFQAFPATRYA